MRNLAIVFALFVCACSSAYEAQREAAIRTDAANKVYPDNYKADILSLLRTYLNDPNNIRDAQISEPALKTIDGASRYSVCVRYNARKSNGQYAGIKDSLVTFRQGRLDRILDPSRDPRDTAQIREQCKDAAMKPFTELERLTR